MFKKQQSNKTLATILIGTCLVTLASCGSEENSSSSSRRQKLQQQEDEGIYRAVLSPMNTDYAGHTAGTIEFRIQGDEVVAEAAITGAPAGVKHPQHVRVGTRCAGIADDRNKDGIIDFEEAALVAGEILLPLDSNLNSQFDGITYGPIANSSGSYVYRRSTSLTEIMADLRAQDLDETDGLAKLPLGQELNLAGRVVEIYGVSTSANLPTTAASFGERSRSQSLPIACGVIERVEAHEEEPTTEVDDDTTTDTTGSGLI